MLKLVRQQQNLREKWLSKIGNTSAVLSAKGTELDGRYSVQVFFSEFFHFEHLLCPRRLLLVEDPAGITSEAKRNDLRIKIPGKVFLHWEESCVPAKNYDATGSWVKSYGHSTCSMEDATITADQFQNLILKCGICATSNLKARDELQEEFNEMADMLKEWQAQQSRLEEARPDAPKKKKKEIFDPDDPDGKQDFDLRKTKPKITMRTFLEIFAKWRMTQYVEWTPKDRKEFGKLTLGELLLKLKKEWREGWGLTTTTSIIATLSEDRWLMARDPLEEALTDLKCIDLKALFDNVKVTYKEDQDARASLALTFVP